ncbi:trichohyalin-like isoform X23 [Pecten maximus]|uniref:trichohyalin-like isoform X23 n=1 Tax=Pecten maximus TaxID=6579 RepID=UPI0014587050|nr:trichohyalin-like isoform X23 [Pecten maximus]
MSSAIVGNSYPPNYNTYNSQSAPNHGQNVQEGYHDPHPSSRHTGNEQQHYRSSPSQPQSVQTTPRRGVFYRLVSPEVGLPLGQYEEQRKSLDEQRQRDYYKMMSQKEKQAMQKRQEEKMKKQAHEQQVQTQKHQQELYNYDEVQKQLKEERRKDYDEFVKMKEEQSKYKQPPTPPGGLNVGQYELYRKRLKEDLVNEYQASLKQQQIEKVQLQLAKARQEYSSLPVRRAVSPLPVKQVELFDPEKTRQQLRDDLHKEYNEFLHEKEQNPSPRRAPTPPNGLDIITQDERTRMAREKQRLYGQELQRQTQEQMLQKIQNNISVIDRRGQQPTGPNQYNHIPPQQHMPPPQQLASPPPRNVAPPHPPPQSSSPPPPQHSQQPQSQMKTPQLPPNQMQNSHREHHQGTPAGYQSPPPRHRSHPTPQRVEQGYYPEFNGKQHSPVESRDGHRPPPHPRRYATPDRPDWARGPPRQNGTPTGRSSHRRDDRQTPSYWNGGIPVKSPATTPSTRTPSTQHSNRTLTPKDTQENMPDIHLESYRKNPISEWRQKERNKEYNAFLNEEDRKAQKKREKLDSMRRQPAVQPKFDHYSNSDNHERHRQNLETERREQYQSFLSQNGEPVYTYARNPSSDLAHSRLSGGLVGGIFGDVQHEMERRRAMVNQRNKEYNDQKKKSKTKEASHEFDRHAAEFGLPLDNEMSNEMRRRQENVRNREYRIFLEKKSKSQEPSQEVFRKAPEFGLPLDNRKSNEMRRQQEKDRNQEYRNFLEEKRHSPRRYQPPTPEEKQGLPLTQKPYDDMRAFKEKQRNVEYNQYLAKHGLPYDKMSLKGSAQQSERQANGYHSETEQRPPQKMHPSKKHDREVAHRVEEEKKNHTRYWNMLNEKKKSEVPRRQGDPSMDEKSMFSDMGKSQEAHKRRMHENAKQDYKNYVDHAFPEGLNRGQPSFAARKQPPDSWYNAQPPTHRHSPPRDYRPEQSNQKSYGNDPYAERLEQARANEAMYRRQDHEMNGQGQRHPPPRQEAPYALH